MVNMTIGVLNPTALPRVKEIDISPRLESLNDKVIGFLWNKKPNGDILLLEIKEQLMRRFHLAKTTWHQKPDTTVPLDNTAVDELLHATDAVINAIGD